MVFGGLSEIGALTHFWSFVPLVCLNVVSLSELVLGYAVNVTLHART